MIQYNMLSRQIWSSWYGMAQLQHMHVLLYIKSLSIDLYVLLKSKSVDLYPVMLSSW
jgi:hypothetical protein